MPLDSRAPSTSTRIAIDVRHAPWFRKIVADYAHNFSALGPYFAGNPADSAAWADVIRRVQSQRRLVAGTTIADVLLAQQRVRNAPAVSIAAAQRLSDPKTVAIVTGQQAGLFGGPLYTLLKALTAVQLAAKVTREHGVRTVAVFWIDAEDHDWDEVGSCRVLDAELELRTVRMAPPAAAGEAPVASVHLDASVEEAVRELVAVLSPTEFSDNLAASLRDAYLPGRGMADAFGRWLESVLGRLGLVVFDSSDPAAKPLAAEVFAREINAPGRTATLAAAAGAELVGRGYHAQVAAQDGSVALFYLNGGRRPIRRAEAGFSIGAENEHRSAIALTAEAQENPSHFSPNVLLRPIVQDTLFPTVCYVAGPNELAYLGQLRRAYEHFDVSMPLVYPRASATLLDSAAVKFLERYALPLEALEAQDDGTLNRLLAAALPESVDQAVQAALNGIEARMAAVITAVPDIDPTLAGAAQSTLGRMQHDLKTLQSKIIQAAKRRDDTLRRQFVRARAQAFPAGHSQQRVVGFIYFLNRYGPALVDRLVEDLPLDFGHHWVLTI